MKKTATNIILLIVIINIVNAQNKVSIYDCLNFAYKYHPLSKNDSLYNEELKKKIKNININWYPDLNISGQFTYQTIITSIDIPSTVPIDIGSPPRDQYKAVLEIKQNIYDGGLTKKLKAIEEESSQTKLIQNKIDINKVKSQTVQVYFSVLLLIKQLNNLFIFSETLKEKEKSVQSAVKNGLVLKSGLYKIKVEVLKLEQEINNLQVKKKTVLEILNQLTHQNFNDSTIFYTEKINNALEININSRPEFELFNSNRELLDASIDIDKSNLMPKAYAFGQFGYGNPGLNMLSNEFSEIVYVGAGLKWQFFDWHKTKRQQEIYSIQKEVINSKQNNFSQAIQIQLKTRSQKSKVWRKTFNLMKKLLFIKKVFQKQPIASMKKELSKLQNIYQS